MDRRIEAALDALDPAGRKLQWLDHRDRWFDAMTAALAAADAAAWFTEPPPIDGSEFWACLSNRQIARCYAIGAIQKGGRYLWWGTDYRTGIPYEPSHPPDTDWTLTNTPRIVAWRMLSPQPESGS